MDYYDYGVAALQPYYALQNMGLNQWSPQRPIVVNPPSDRIQAVIAAGAVKIACENSIAATEKNRADAERDLIEAIKPLPETIEQRVTQGGFWPFNWREIEMVKTVPTDAEQAAYRDAAEKQAKETAKTYNSPSGTVKTLLALASHFPPSQPMPLEGQYLTAIAPFLEPFEPHPNP